MRPVTDLQRTVAPFEVISEYTPSGDQPKAITELSARINAGEKDVVLLGATGTGKSATTAWLIEQVQRPTLVMAPNKTLAAQLATEFRELLPNNAVEYFVSYYDYYQPEAYIAQTDTYIEKDSSINDEVERLRHSATSSLLTRRDVIVVASVCCIYGLGTPQEYVDRMVTLSVGDQVDRDQLLRKFVTMQYTRNDMAFTRGTFRVRGRHGRDHPGVRGARHPDRVLRRRDRGDRHAAPADRATWCARSSRCTSSRPPTTSAGPERMERAINGIELELEERLAELERQNKLLEAQRLRMRTTYDIEMMRQIGSCSGIENYSRHIDGRSAGTAPNTLIDYFPEDFLLVIDESHVTVPQIGAMFEGDMSRKRALVDHGFRLPSATDNRPLRWEEFVERIGQTVYLSATPGNYELSMSDGVVEQIIRPTGLVDPEVVVKPTTGQIDDLLGEIHDRVEKDERVLVTTLTKKMAEDLTDYFLEKGVRVRYLHSEVDTLRRVELLRELRLGEYDVLVGINLLREGLDLPEVSLVAILDADKEGFLRSGRSLIQTIGRAARNVSGEVHMYADRITDGMAQAIEETEPPPRAAGRLQPRARHRPDAAAQEDRRHHGPAGPRGRRHGGAARGRRSADQPRQGARCPGFGSKGAPRDERTRLTGAAAGELADLIQQLSDQMHAAAGELQFELAARLRDEISGMKKELRQMQAATA